jgi:F0F1-type ATP synthase assembly protein I
MKPIDLAAVERQAKRMRRVQAGVDLLRDMLAAIFVGLLLCSPIFWQMAVDAGIFKD